MNALIFEKHSPSSISNSLMVLGKVTENDIKDTDFRKNLADDLKLVMDETLEECEDVSGIERICFTEFIIQ